MSVADTLQLRNVLLILALCSLAACSSVPESAPKPVGVEVDAVTIINQLAISITDVQVLAPVSGNFVSCGNIIGRSACSTGFPNNYYSSNPVIVSWKEQGQPQSTDEFVVKIGSDIDINRPAQLEVFIFSPGQAGAKLVQ